VGMYDNIICKYPLPMPDDPKGYSGSNDFQTKDLDLSLSTYTIDENGQLFIHRFEGEWEPGNKDSDSFIGKIGHFKTTKKWLEKLNSTITIIFYDYQKSDNTDYDYSIEYEAIFVEGKITSLKLLGFRATENAERKINDAEFNKQLREHHKFTKTRRYKYFVKPYNKIISYIFRKFRKASCDLSFFLNKIERKIKI
jgi:hypothetical protein